METSLVPSSFFDCFAIHIFIFFFITTFFYIEDIFINIFLSLFSATAKDFVSTNSFTWLYEELKDWLKTQVLTIKWSAIKTVRDKVM